jgi:hypothetical protein
MSKIRHPYTFSLDEEENVRLDLAKKNCGDGKLITVVRAGIACYADSKLSSRKEMLAMEVLKKQLAIKK